MALMITWVGSSRAMACGSTVGTLRTGDCTTAKIALEVRHSRNLCDFNPGIRHDTTQSILFTDIAAENKSALEAIIKKNKLPLSMKYRKCGAGRWPA